MSIGSIFKTAFLYFTKIRVVHSIPGRLRVSVPGLNRVPERVKKYENYITELICLVGGINEVSYSYITNKILFKYDTSKVSEKKIIQWLNEMWNEIIRKEEECRNLSDTEIEKNIHRFYEDIRESLKKIGR